MKGDSWRMKRNYNSGLSWNFHTIAHRSIEWHLFSRCCCSGIKLKYGGFFSLVWMIRAKLVLIIKRTKQHQYPTNNRPLPIQKGNVLGFFWRMMMKKPQSNNMKAMKVLMAIADDNRIKFSMVMQSVPEIGFRLEKLNSICSRLLKSLTTRYTCFVFCVCVLPYF